MESSRTIIMGVGSIAIIALFFLCRSKWKHVCKHGYLGIFLGCLFGNIFGPSSFLSTMVGGRYYPAWVVGFVGALGAIVGEILNYNMGALGQTATKDQYWSGLMHQYTEQQGFFMIIVFTAIPNPVLNVAALMSGALHYPMLQFVMASFFGNWLQFFLTAFVGGLTNRIL